MTNPSSPVLAANNKPRFTDLPWELEIVEDGDCDADGMGGSVSWGTGQDVFSGCIGHRDMQTGDFDIVAEHVKEANAAFICRAANSHAALVAAVTDAVNYLGLCDCGLDSCSNCGKQSVPSKLRAALALATGENL